MYHLRQKYENGSENTDEDENIKELLILIII